MKRYFRIPCLLTILMLLLTGASLAEAVVPAPIALVSYDHTALIDWTPGYGLSMPGVLLELTHPEGMLSITAIEKDGQTPEKYLSGRLDRAGELLAVSNAEMKAWTDLFGGDGRCLSFRYTYPDGDEEHLAYLFAATLQEDVLIELSIDTWGLEAEALMNTALTFFAEGGISIAQFEHSTQLFATLTDVVEDEHGLTQVQLTEANETFLDGEFYPFAENAVVLFPNPDDPSLLYPVAPDTASLVDAILTYEENSDGPATFRAVICEEQIVYMEYSLLQ